jgi:predicted amidohydrolase
MGTTPPPIPIRGNRLTVTEKMLRGDLMVGGITGGISQDLTAVCNALRALELAVSQTKIQAETLSRDWAKWLGGSHFGELSVLKPTADFKTISDFVARFQPPPAPLGAIAVGLFTVVNNGANFTLSLQHRFNRLETALANFSSWLASVNQARLQHDNAFLGIFIAPEYYWTLPDPLGKRHFLNIDSKNQIELALKQLSKSYPRILIVPGTVHYDVQLDAQGKIEAGYQLLKAAKDRILREQALANPKSVLDKSMKHQQTGPNSKVASMNELADKLLDKTTAPKKVHNLTYLLLDGKIWSQYDKHTDFYETKSISPDRSMFIPGTQDECPEIGNATRKFRFGVEICFDHGNGVLKRRNPTNLHFHIVVSDCVGNQMGNVAVKNGGYFLHASTNYNNSVVWHKLANGQMVNETVDMNLMSIPLGSDHLDYYLLQLPNV